MNVKRFLRMVQERVQESFQNNYSKTVVNTLMR